LAAYLGEVTWDGELMTKFHGHIQVGKLQVFFFHAGGGWILSQTLVDFPQVG